MNAKDHYQNHLANFYSWMIGNFAEKQLEQEHLFKVNDIKPQSNKISIDLGAGNGLQSVGLARLGFNVFAVDFNGQLLDELNSNKGDLPVQTVVDDALHFMKAFDGKAELIICMGDTITHLESITQVELLVAEISNHLSPGGKVILSFRDLVKNLNGDDRFIPVRSDENRIHTCFLEYFDTHVMVHDILHERHSGKWMQKVSSYPKLRMGVAQMELLLEREFKILYSQCLKGMNYLIAQKIR